MARTRRPQRRRPDQVRAEDPVCPVCLGSIRPKDRVAGTRDDLLHEQCDYLRRRDRPDAWRRRD